MDTSLAGPAAPAEGPGRRLADRYQVESELKRGGGVATLLARDVRSGRRVVVKMVEAGSVSAGARMRLEHESRVLSGLDSERLASILEVVVHEGSLLLVMPLAEGMTLDRRLADGPVPIEEAVTIAIELFEALAEAHSSGVIHRDVKPSNVVVSDGSDGSGGLRVTLVDFGLARSGWSHAGRSAIPVGTARYVSPEQAGLLRHDVDERSDLYSAGALLFELFAGRPPFDGETVGEVLRSHATARPPRLRSLGLDVPGALDEIIQRLLRKDPRDRYQGARAVVADLRQLAAGLAAGLPDPAVVVGVHDERATLTEPAFVGRALELQALEEAASRAGQGAGELVLVESESGGGKSRLLDELAQRREAAGGWVLRGQGLDQAASVPFQLLAGVAEEVAAAAALEPELRAQLVERVGDHADGVRAALPGLKVVLPGSGSQVGPEEFGPARVSASVSWLLDSLGTPERPALVILDDCQWADEPTVRLISRWAASSAGRHTTVVAAFRSEEVPDDHPLRRSVSRTRLSLPPFDPHDVRGLVESMAGPLPEEAVEVVAELADGSPFMASAVLRGLVEIGALVREGDEWVVDESGIADAQSSRRAAAFLSRRLALLPAPVRRLLTVGAVLGKEFAIDLAAALAEQSGGEAVVAIDEARRRHILWNSSAGRCAFVHDKLREGLLSDLTGDELATLHLRAAETLESEEPLPVFDLGYHFDAGGEPQRALPYALAAADEARRRHALELSETQYRVAKRGASSDGDRLRAATGLGEVLLLQGRYAEAQVELEAAHALASDDSTRAEMERRLGELAFKRGDVVEASRSLERALALMGGRRRPTSTVLLLAMLLWEVLVQAGHTLVPGRLGRRDPGRGEADLAAARVYSRMAYAYWFSRGRLPTAWAHLRGMNIAERYPPGPELAQAWSEHAPVLTMLPWFSRAMTYAQRSLAIREELGDVWGQGQSLHFHGVALYGASRYEECIEQCRRAVRLLQRTGDQWEVHTATWHIAFAEYRLGRLADAVETAKRVHSSGSELGDQQAVGIGLGAWSKASEGALPAAFVAQELRRPRDDVHTSAEVLQAEALRRMAAGEVQAAVDVLREADGLVRRAGLRQEYVSPVVAWLATAQRMLVEQLDPLAQGRRRSLLREARRTSRRALRTARWYRNNLPHALREAGLVAALAGRQRPAVRMLRRSLAVAEEQGADHERALTMVALGRVGAAAGRPDAADMLRDGEALLAVQAPAEVTDGAGPTLSLVDRFDQLLEQGRTVAGALSRDDALAAMALAAEALLRPQVVRVVELAGGRWDDSLSGSGSSDLPAVSRTLVERAVALGRPVSTGRDLAGDPGESMLLSGSRSALAAPVHLHGEPVACLYVAHEELGDLYGEDDERVAQLLTAIASAALENAEGFAEVQALTRTLEQRVTDRTEELAAVNRELQVALDREKDVADRLRSLDQLKNEFVAMVAHDLRSPMVSIASAAKMLMGPGDSLGEGDRAQLLEVIHRSTTGLAGLVEDVLQVARIESGQFSYDIGPFDMAALVRRTVEEVRMTAVPCRIEAVIGADLPLALGDEERNWQVLTNLLSNAVKFSPEVSTVRVRVVATGDHLQVSVQDEGDGIAPEDIPRLFQKFSRIGGRSRGPVKGTGLGLFICRSIVEAQGGRIWVDSEQGRGSTFTYTVPVAGPEAAADR